MSTATATPIETPSKAAASALAQLDVKEDKPTLLSKMMDARDESVSDKAARPAEKHASRTTLAIKMDDGTSIPHATTTITRKYVGDLSITDDSQEPLLQETEQRFVLFPIQYHDVSSREKLQCIFFARSCPSMPC